VALILGVAGGGVMGVLSRYGIDTYVERRSEGAFPWATFLVNVSGCLAVGFVIAALVDRQRGPQWLRVGLVMGFCGGFTTFSTFAQETLDLLQDDKAAIALGSVAANLVLGLAAVWVGTRVGRAV
jgi:fluoride exporter